LLDLICKHVLPGSIIYKDSCAAYIQIKNLENPDTGDQAFIFKVAYHSIEYITSEGIHTNTIEGSWRGLKQHIPVCVLNIDVDECLLEKVWRRKNHTTFWDSLLIAFKNIHY